MQLRQRPYIDRTHIGVDWTTEWRYQVLDLFSGRGGVGRALLAPPTPLDPWTFVGVDIEDYSDVYPGEFVQADLLTDPSAAELVAHLDSPTIHYPTITVDRATLDDSYGLPAFDGVAADVVWCSFPCTGYSSLAPTHYGSREAALEANPRITDKLREFLLELAPHYVIENVPGATRAGDLHANVRVNGLAFGLPFDLERHFETTFNCPDAHLAGDADVVVDTRGDQSVRALAEAKNVPAEWGKQGVRSAMPRQYVDWVLHHCPTVPTPAPKRIESTLWSPMSNLHGIEDHPHARLSEGAEGGR